MFTPRKQDAYQLASDAHGRPPVEEIHTPLVPSPTGRFDVYFPHFHPGGIHHAAGAVRSISAGAAKDWTSDRAIEPRPIQVGCEGMPRD
jgi:hypothetical protein